MAVSGVPGFSGATLRTTAIDISKFHQRPNEIRLKRDLMDRQIVRHRRPQGVRVNDLRLDRGRRRACILSPWTSAAPPACCGRLGIEGPWRTLARGLHREVPERYIDWEDVDPVERTIPA